MSSSLRYSSTPSTAQYPTIRQSAVTASPPPKKQKMSLTQTYMLATVARRQLQKEAARADHDLRLLVGHANLLDGLMLDLANAEQEQESWFNQSVNSASKASSADSKHIQWVDSNTIPEEPSEEDIYEEESDDDESDSDDEETVEIAQKATCKLPQITTTSVIAADEDQEMDDEFDEELSLTRSPSHSASPPELMHEDSEESESDDDSLPPSPPRADFPINILSHKQRQAIATTSLYQSSSEEEESSSIFDHQTQPIAIAAC